MARSYFHRGGGAPLLGVNGVCLISHGSSEARTISQAILRSRQFLETSVNEAISSRLGELEEIAA